MEADEISVPESEQYIPQNFSLGDIYPNPFNSRARISFTLSQPADLQLSIYDLLGKEVTSLADGIWSPGDHMISIKAYDLASGTYFVRLVGDNKHNSSKKLILTK